MPQQPEANWLSPGQWVHAIKYLTCRALYGKHCPHIPGVGRNLLDV